MINLTENEIYENLKNSNLSLEISSVPTNENILKIIEFFKAVEIASGRMENEEALKKHYLNFACYDLAILLKMIYKDCDEVKFNQFSTKFPMLFSRSVTSHYVIEFNGNYFDINGMHTLEELENYCLSNYSWNGVSHKVKDPLKEHNITSIEDYMRVMGEIIGNYCLSNIKVKPEKTLS